VLLIGPSSYTIFKICKAYVDLSCFRVTFVDKFVVPFVRNFILLTASIK